MTDQDAQALRRLVTLYGSQKVLRRVEDILLSFAGQDRGKWGGEEYRMRAAMKGYNHPSQVQRMDVSTQRRGRKVKPIPLDPWEGRRG